MSLRLSGHSRVICLGGFALLWLRCTRFEACETRSAKAIGPAAPVLSTNQLALGFGKDTSWRASREKKQCASTSSQSTQTAIGSAVQYFCLYQTARLTYSATLISTP